MIEASPISQPLPAILSRPVRGKGIQFIHIQEYPQGWEEYPGELDHHLEAAKTLSPILLEEDGKSPLSWDTVRLNKWQNSFSLALTLETTARPPQKGLLGEDLYSWHLSRNFNDQRPAFSELTAAHQALQIAMKRDKSGGNVVPDSVLAAHRIRRETFNEIAQTAREKRTILYGQDRLGDQIWQSKNPGKFSLLAESVYRNANNARVARRGAAGANLRSYTDENYVSWLNEQFDHTDFNVLQYARAYANVDGRPVKKGWFNLEYPDSNELLKANGVPVNSALAYFSRIAEVQIGKKVRSSFPAPENAASDTQHSEEELTALLDPHMLGMEPVMNYYRQRATALQRRAV